MAMLTIFLMAIHSLNNVFLAVIISNIIDAATIGSMDKFLTNAIAGLVGFAFFMILGILMVRSRTKLVKKINVSIKRTLINDIVYFSNNTEEHTSELSLMTNDLKQLETKGIEAELKIVQLIFTALFAFVAALYFDIWITIAFLIGSLIPVIISIASQTKIRKASTSWIEANSVYTSRLKDFFNGIETVRTYQVEDKIVNEATSEAEKMEDGLRNMNRTVETIDQIVYMSAMICSVLIPFGVGVYRIIQYGVTLGIFMAIVQLSNSITNPVMQIMQLFNGYGTTKGIKERYLEAFKRDESESREVDPDYNFSSIELKDVEVKVGDYQLFSKLNLKIENGDKVLIIGPSGAGKSTLLRIVQQAIPISKGSYLFNNEKKDKSLMKIFSLIRQQPLIFNDSLRYNITLGEDYTDDEVIDAVRIAQLKDLVDEKGLNYLLGENGKNLSGGQLQRVEISRAIIRKRPIILADEMTSALDENTSSAVRSNLLKSPYTLIEVAHKITEEEKMLYDQIWDVSNF